MFRSNWLGLEEWKNDGLEIRSTASNEAVKLYDAALHQYACFYDDPNLGGLINTLEKLNQADPNFILGKTLSLNVRLFGFTESYYHDVSTKNDVDLLMNLIDQKKDEITEREYKHVQATSKMSKMDLNGSAQIYEQILNEYPNDLLALKTCFYHYFFTGQKKKMLQLVAKSYPHFTEKSNPYSLFMDGIMGFVLEENYQYNEAEKYANLGLSKNCYDGWATHTLAHVYEMDGRFELGKDFMTKNIDFWTRTNLLACHNYWHLSLFNISMDNFDEANLIFDKQILPRLQQSKTSFNITDGCSFLYRLSLLQNNNNNLLQSKFSDVHEVSKAYLNQHILGFVDVHYLMACLGSGNLQKAEKMLETIKTSRYWDIREEQAKLTEKLMESMILFYKEKHEQATDLLLSIHDDIILIGGSDAQRDVFNQLLIVSAMKSPKKEHKKLLQKLILEREEFKKNDKFIQKCNQIYQQQK